MFLNDCQPGYGCNLLDDPLMPTGQVCAFFCDASGMGSPGCGDGPGPAFTCVPINGFYGDVDNVATNIGMCVDCMEWSGLGVCGAGP